MLRILVAFLGEVFQRAQVEDVLKKNVLSKSSDVFVKNIYRVSFFCFLYRIQRSNLALDMEFLQATIAVL